MDSEAQGSKGKRNGDPNCEHCKGTGEYILKPDGFAQIYECQCVKTLDVKSQFRTFVEGKMRQGLLILMEKRALRGTANITRQGLQGVVTRMAEDKLSRIQRSVEDVSLRRSMRARGIPEDIINQWVPDPDAKKETRDALEDDLLDTANYCYIALALLAGQWEEGDDA